MNRALSLDAVGLYSIGMGELLNRLPTGRPADMLGPNAQDHPRRVVCAGREPHIGPEVDASEPLQQLCCAALGHPAGATHYQVLAEAHGVHDPGFKRQRDAVIASDVTQFLPVVQVSADDLVTVEPDPHDAQLGAAITVERDQMRELAASDHRASGSVEDAHTGAA